MKTFTTDKAPAAVGPYAQAVRSGEWLFCSGQIGLVPGTRSLAGEEIESQSRQMLANMEAILAAAGLSIMDVAKTTVFLVDMNDFNVFNDIYAAFFHGHTPARSTIQVGALPLGALVEIECIAAFQV